MAKRILFIGAGLETVPGIVEAKKMGLSVVVSDINTKAPGVKVADDFIYASTYDIKKTLEEVVKFNQLKKINAVLCLATDVPLTVATIAQKLGLPGIPISAAKAVSDKYLMKKIFRSANIPIPTFRAINGADELKDFIKENNYPVVTKPFDSRGARGVVKIVTGIELEWAFNCSLQNSPSGNVIVEKYLEGPQLSTESLIVDGKAFTIGLSDRNYEYLERFAPYIIENGGDLPSFLNSKLINKVKDVIQDVANCLSITNGVIKGDIVIHQNNVFVIEVAGRLSGGYFCTHEIPLNTGINFVHYAIKIALGEKIEQSELQPPQNRFVVQRYLFPKPGLVTKITGVDSARNSNGVEFLEMRVEVGDVISSPKNHPGRAGVIIVTGVTRDEAINNAVEAINKITIETIKS